MVNAKIVAVSALVCALAYLATPTAGNCAAITYIGTTFGSGVGPTVTIAVPTGTQNGDVMLAYVATQETAAGSIPTPTGWTQVTSTGVPTFNAIQGAQLWWRVANNEPASYTWSGTSYPEGVIRTYRNVNPTPIDASAGCGTYATSCAIPAMHGIAAEQYVGFWDNDGAAQTITLPTGFGNAATDHTQRSMAIGDLALTGTAPIETATSSPANYFDGIGVTLVQATANVPVVFVPPAICGSPQVNQTLTVTPGVFTGSPTSVAYKWLRNGTAISGATGTSYPLVTADQGTTLMVQEIATNAAGPSLPSTSAATSQIVAAGGGGGSNGNAIAANDFLSSIAVDINGTLTGTGTGFTTWLPTALQYIGVRWIRGWAPEAGTVTPAQFVSLAQAVGSNVKLTVGMGSMCQDINGFNCPTYHASNSEIAPVISAADTTKNAGILIGVEGANEPDNWGGYYNGVPGGAIGGTAYSWVPVMEIQRDLRTAVRGDATLNGVPVWGLTHGGHEIDNAGAQCLVLDSTCAGASLVTLMTAGTVFADWANMHNYTICTNCTYTPQDNVAWNSADPVNGNLPGTGYPFYSDYENTWYHSYQGYSATQAPGVPKVTTETGWYLGDATAQAIGAKIDLSTYLSQFKRGYKYTAIYAIASGDGFQWYNSSGVAVGPVAGYIHNLTTILADTVAFTTGTLNYSITSEPATVHDLLLQKSNGNFELVVWDEQCPSGSTAGTNCTQPVPTQSVTVNLGASYGTVNTYDPTQGTSAVAPCATACTNISSVVLPLTDHPYIIEVH